MKISIHADYKKTTAGQEASRILSSCVHCGFCLATCPTYQELQDERDGPRGRIYLLKELFETGKVTQKTRVHLDRCLTCRACETTCPSGVEYGKLIDIGRGVVEQQVSRPLLDRIKRRAIRYVLPYPRRFTFLLGIGQLFRPFMPFSLKEKVPAKSTALPWPVVKHKRTMIALEGCAQPSATPNTNAATARVLDALGIALIAPPKAGCCGAVDYHLGAHADGLDFMRRNIDAWWPSIEQGAEAIMMAASGCGVMVKEYGEYLKHDPEYAQRASKVSDLACDLSEILIKEDLHQLNLSNNSERISVHCPCTLQHGQKLPDILDTLLKRAGFILSKTEDKHLCCGSAGTYSILQPTLSNKLRDNKLVALTVDEPDMIVTANIGCQLHLQGKSPVPVKHWIEIIDEAMTVPNPN
ncbi:MAG: glycolate oxidase iron-sulfur subunit [Paraglaciecola sp.]|jgi:glycolate oxidase iron-sulfur subunit